MAIIGVMSLICRFGCICFSWCSFELFLAIKKTKQVLGKKYLNARSGKSPQRCECVCRRRGRHRKAAKKNIYK